PLRGLPPTEVALLNGGRRLAVYSSLAALRAAGAVQTASGYLMQVGPVPVGAPDLDRAIHAAAGQRPLRSGDILTDPRVAGALDRAEAQLTDAGLVLTPSQRSHVRRGALAFLALLLLGIVRAIRSEEHT